jgi:hypothetical protein
MACMYVIQPNGKFARFSTTVDDFTHFDMTKQEAWEVACETSVTCEKALDRLRDVELFPERFDGAIETIRIVHGAERADSVRRQLSA